MIKPPQQNTLDHYGLTRKEWVIIFRRQGRRCPICKQKDKKFVIDHFHIIGWKKMQPHERKKYVRGIVCLYCNYRILQKGITKEKMKNAIKYLSKFEETLK